MANYLIQTADKRLLDALDVLLGALLNAQRGRTPDETPLPANSEGGSVDEGDKGKEKAEGGKQ